MLGGVRNIGYQSTTEYDNRALKWDLVFVSRLIHLVSAHRRTSQRYIFFSDVPLGLKGQISTPLRCDTVRHFFLFFGEEIQVMKYGFFHLTIDEHCLVFHRTTAPNTRQSTTISLHYISFPGRETSRMIVFFGIFGQNLFYNDLGFGRYHLRILKHFTYKLKIQDLNANEKLVIIFDKRNHESINAQIVKVN